MTKDNYYIWCMKLLKENKELKAQIEELHKKLADYQFQLSNN